MRRPFPRWLILTLLCGISLAAIAQSPKKLFDAYIRYREPSIQHRRFKQKDILPLIRRMQGVRGAQVEEIGRSVEGRPLYVVQIGHGDTPVLLWSQMHGDEPTATMAIMDIFNFFRAEKDGFDAFRQKILDRLTLYFIPMLNPDGAQRFTRRNALQIDLNRDAHRLATPEAQALKKMRDRTRARFGFNLHDQQIYYTAGHTSRPATITFLAPAFNREEDMNDVRADAARLIVYLNQIAQYYVPGGVGKWNDDFEPRAFGEMMTKWGTSTVLIESGGYKNDPEKQFIRKLNFVLLLAAFDAIAQGKYRQEDVRDYFRIPKNQRMLNDLIIRRLRVPEKGHTYLMDISFRKHEISYAGATKFYPRAYVQDKGDLLTFYGYDELDADGLHWQPGRIYPKHFRSLRHFLHKRDPKAILKQGYTAVRIRHFNPADIPPDFPLQVLGRHEAYHSHIRLGQNPSFFIADDQKIRYAVVNGRLIKILPGS